MDRIKLFPCFFDSQPATSNIFLMYLLVFIPFQFYHLYLWTGNQKLLQDLWPVARKALIWLMRDSTGGSGLPLRKTCTYDIIYLEGYDHTTYNSVMYLLGLRVGKVLAETLGEKQLADTIELAFNYGKAKIDRILWNEKDGFYHSWWDHEKGSPDWLMADSLYGQVSFRFG